ncbi:hypothetical protein L1987_20737 [Smallanthus sonchifolius]|uniref:Uncharacterized protein n=1 Tax=Smallanthus sonchifolius TaxID=185202 RepID=A0ACB9IT62_9ASTR|nr:hypothetical protein L1987_20737 [Smallanthus sonchifolius]
MDVGNDTIWRPCVPVQPAKSSDGQLVGPPNTSDSQQPGLSRGEAKLVTEDWEGAVADIKAAAEKSP